MYKDRVKRWYPWDQHRRDHFDKFLQNAFTGLYNTFHRLKASQNATDKQKMEGYTLFANFFL